MKRWLERAAAVGLLLFLLAGLGRAVFRPKDINTYENRYAAKLTAPTAAGLLDGSWQSGVNGALGDQVPFAQRMKKLYNQTTATLLRALLCRISRMDPDRYVGFHGLFLFGNGRNLLYRPVPLETQADALAQRADGLNALFAAHPELTFSVCFLERDTETDFETGEHTGAAAKLLDGLSLPADQKLTISTADFPDYCRRFFETDHHWKAEGAYEGYLAVLSLLGGAGEPLQPAGELICLNHAFSGSKAAAAGAQEVMTEEFRVYPFDFPPMTTTIDGVEGEYGSQSNLAYRENGVSYASYYGYDSAEVIFDTHRPEAERLLVLGESYDNAILRLLACHYDRTYGVDLRHYQRVTGKAFDLGEYTRSNQIDQVLLIGSNSYFTTDTFLPGG